MCFGPPRPSSRSFESDPSLMSTYCRISAPRTTVASSSTRSACALTTSSRLTTLTNQPWWVMTASVNGYTIVTALVAAGQRRATGRRSIRHSEKGERGPLDHGELPHMAHHSSW
ncbi:hypothetical protein P154DRAFT_525787 [Amniculicola lignicola CBS 123094]|uniref:Uncharacterized protein n=1 Tax=Amniculicola lignicola CBS 123094 TaxID=1392246 RepID=A0A6A5W2W0_9PLEO|nr:hypothetical protein P154DRAFT_525787 [Amniculicola lignicola CBS 123094]